jgi:hypothetical protein
MPGYWRDVLMASGWRQPAEASGIELLTKGSGDTSAG